MQLLQEVRNSFDSMGFSPKSDQLSHKFLNNFIINFSGYILLWIYLLRDANSSLQYMESIYMITVCSCIFLSAVSTVFLQDELFLFIDTLNSLFNESKSWNLSHWNSYSNTQTHNISIYKIRIKQQRNIEINVWKNESVCWNNH